MNTPKTVDEYIAEYPKEIQDRMREVREAIKTAAPEADEIISWGMPTYKGKKNIVHFAAHKNHIGFYPGADGIVNFKEKLEGYKTSKGAVQFPNNKPLPLALIREITESRAREDCEG